MNKQIILSALQAQLDTKKAEVSKYEETVYDPAKKSMQAEVLAWLRENVSQLISNIDLSADRIEFMKASQPSSSWGAATVYLESDWRSKTREFYCKLNWYGSSATLQDENTLMDVQVFGALAANLGLIEYQLKTVWRPVLLDMKKPVETLYTEINQIDRSIRETKDQIRNEEINTYKQPGFFCSLNKVLRIDYSHPDNSYNLVEHAYEISLSTGRGKWDYERVSAFKILSTNKYKTTLAVTGPNNTITEVTVSNKSFETFIANVYNWQTTESEVSNTGMTERYNRSYANRNDNA